MSKVTTSAPAPGNHGNSGSMSLKDLISAAEQGLIAMSPTELQQLKSAATEPVRHSPAAASDW